MLRQFFKTILFFLLLTSTSIAMAANDSFLSGWYLGATGGMSIYPSGELNDLNNVQGSDANATLYFKKGYAVGGILGYQFCNHVRLEGEVTYRKNNGDHFSFPGFPDGSLPGYISSVAYFLNGYYDIVNFCGLKPYIGGGLGGVSLRNRIPSLESSTNVFAYQLGTGIRYQNCHYFADLGYRYLGTRNPHYDFVEPNTQIDTVASLPYRTHNIMLSFGYQF